MNEQIPLLHPGASRREARTKIPQERSGWLELARQQSQKLARTRSQFTPPLRWDRLEQAPARWRRLSWAVALLPLLIVGGATGTWAFVTHLQTRQPDPVAAPLITPLGQTPRRAVAPRRRPAVPTKVKEQVPVPPKPRRTVRPRQTTAAAPVETAREETQQEEQKVEQVPSTEPQRVIFGTSDAPAEPAIIVSPPAKMRPLWTPEAFKKKGMSRIRWGW